MLKALPFSRCFSSFFGLIFVFLIYPENALQSANRAHDRYIVLDDGTKDMKVYHCGASSKDAGKKITTITRLTDIDGYKITIRTLLGNPQLVLR